MKRIILSVSFLLIIALCSSDEENINQKKQRILDELLKPEVYDKRVRPKGSGPTNVTVTMYVLDIIDMDQYLRDFTLQCYFRQKWKDQRLAFQEKTDDPEIRKIRSVETDRIWKPDLFFVNDIKGEIHDIMVPNHFLRISNDGEILFSNRVSVILSCHSNLMFYPHDEQKCYMRIESYGFPLEELALEWGGNEAVKFSEELQSNSKFILLDHGLKEIVTVVNETTYSNLELELYFSRNFHAFLVSVYLPHILLVILSWTSFFIDNKNVTLRLIYLGLIMFLMLRLVPSEGDPDIHITALDIWTAVCVMFILSSFLESIFVHQLANQEDAEKAKEDDAEQQAVNSGHINVEKVEKVNDSSKKSRLLSRLTEKYSSRSKKVDVVCHVLSSILFLFFNIIYWSVCCSASKYV